jgi:hypothetical protein
MENFMANEQIYSDPNLYNDGSGRGAMINPPLSTPELAMKNMQTLRPGGAAYVQLPGGQKAQMNAEQTEEEDQRNLDYLESLFSGENLSDEFMAKAATIFEAAIHEKVTIVEKAILEAAKEVIQEQVEEKTEYLTEQLDSYLNYVITEWMDDNKVAVERGLRTEIAEHFMVGIKELLDETFIDVPESKYDIIEEMANANDELQNQLNEEIRKNIQLSNEITARLCAESFFEISNGLTDTEVEKLATLAEGIEFANVDQYKEKVKLLKESYFNRQTTPQQNYSTRQNLVEENLNPNAIRENNDPVMSSLVNAIGRLNKNRVKQPAQLPENSNNGKLLNMLNTNIATDQYI